MVAIQTVGKLLGGLSAAILFLTIAAVPWMLGGVIPLARLTLLAGALAAAALSLVSALLQRKPPHALPLLALPLVGLALLGSWQLRTLATHPMYSMKHTVGSLDDAQIPDTATTASLLEAETRTTIATLLALALIATTAFDRVRTPRSLMWGSLIFIVNGIGATTIGLTQLFQQQGFSLNKEWALGLNQGSGAAAFATFINPNNAAGWLCLGFACAVGWMSFHLAKSGVDGKPQFGKLNIPIWEDTLRRSMQFISDLSTWHILTIIAVAFLGAGVAATQSRGGILAAVIGVTIAASIKSSLKRLPVVLLLIAICGGGVYGLLHWLELDKGIVGELETLKDLDEAAGTRPQHWLDSLHVVLDFPLTGTGLGSYRFATLPYRSFTGTTWFRNADNQFVDMLIEGGISGLTLFVSIGLIGLFTGFAGWKEQKTRSIAKSATAPRVSRRMLGAIGSVAVLSTLTQAVSGFFDYGVGMPAASCLLVAILSACSGFLAASVSVPSPRRSASLACYPLLAIGMQSGLIVAAGAFLQDQWAAVEIDKSVVDGHRVLMKPVEPDKLDQVESLMQTLEQRLSARPDDAEGMRTLTRLADADFRWKVVLAAKGDAAREAPGFGMLWERTTLNQIMGSLAELHLSDPALAASLRDQLTQLSDAGGLPELFQKTQTQYPLMPQIAETRCSIAVLQNDMPAFERQARHAMFVQPANAGAAMTLGTLALQCQQPLLAQQLWQTSLKYSEEFRPAMLVSALRHWSSEETMELFGPKTYSECVQAARNSRDRQQQSELWQRAENIWNALIESQDEHTNSLRAAHLIATNRADEAVKWLEQCMKAEGDNLILSRDLARLLEKQQHYRASLDQWYRIQFLVPGDSEAETAITRIMNLK